MAINLNERDPDLPGGTREPRGPRLPTTVPAPDVPLTPAPIEPGTTDPGAGPNPDGKRAASVEQDADVLPADMVGDIPPPPIPSPPPIVGPGVAGIRGTEAGTLSLPGTRGAMPFRTAAFQPVRPRFGPGVPVTGGTGAPAAGLGLDPEQAAEILRALAGGGGLQ